MDSSSSAATVSDAETAQVIDTAIASAFIGAHHVRYAVDTTMGNQPSDREAPPLAPEEEISSSPASPPAPPAAAILEPPAPPAPTSAVSPAHPHGTPPPTCACGCGAPTTIAKKSDRRTGAIAGQPQKFIKGHVARLRPKLDITPEKFWGRVEKFTPAVRLPAATPLPPEIEALERQAAALALRARRGGSARPARGEGCLLYPHIQITVAGRRVRARHVALLLHEGLPVTAEALERLKARGLLRRNHRCNSRCVNLDHAVVLRESSEDIRRRAEAIEAARARMMASRATTQ